MEGRGDQAELMVIRLIRNTQRFSLCNLEAASESDYPFDCIFEEQEGETENGALDAWNCQMQIHFALSVMIDDPGMQGTEDVDLLQFVAMCERQYGKREEAAVPALYDFCVQWNLDPKNCNRAGYRALTLEEATCEWKRRLMHRAAQLSKTEKSDEICEALEQELEEGTLDPTTAEGWRRYSDMIASIENASGEKKRRISAD
jgi:hypothetical protein